MAEQLEIVDVRVGAPRAARFAPSQQHLDVAIEVRNNSRNTLHAIASVRSLDYDSATQTLFVGLSEPEPKPEFRPSNFIAPHTKAIPPKQSETIEVSVPSVIHKLLPSGKLGMGVETLDVSGVHNVRCEVSFDTTPFYPKQADSPEAMSRALRSWGQRTEKTMERTAGGETSDSTKRPRKSRRE